MQCPKCGIAVQPAATECPACGVILAKVSSYSMPPRVAPRPSAPPKQGTPAVIKLALAVAAVWFVWHLFNAKTTTAAGWYEGADGYEKALAEQKTNGKPVMVYFHTAWCGYCKQLDADVFSTAAFSHRYGDSLLKVQINPEKGRAENSIAHQYNVHGYPTVYIVTASRTSEPIIGYGGSEGFYARLAGAMGN